MDYRQYEDPWKLQEQLKVAKQRRDEALEDGNEGEYEYYCEDIADLEWRLKLAWADNEFDSEQRAAYEVERFYEDLDEEEAEFAALEIALKNEVNDMAEPRNHDDGHMFFVIDPTRTEASYADWCVYVRDEMRGTISAINELLVARKLDPLPDLVEDRNYHYKQPWSIVIMWDEMWDDDGALVHSRPIWKCVSGEEVAHLPHYTTEDFAWIFK